MNYLDSSDSPFGSSKNLATGSSRTAMEIGILSGDWGITKGSSLYYLFPASMASDQDSLIGLGCGVDSFRVDQRA